MTKLSLNILLHMSDDITTALVDNCWLPTEQTMHHTCQQHKCTQQFASHEPAASDTSNPVY